MKEAAGEANMTVITIVLIAIVLAVGTVIITNLMNNTRWRSLCTQQGYTYSSNGQCLDDGTVVSKHDLCVNSGGTWQKGTCTNN